MRRKWAAEQGHVISLKALDGKLKREARKKERPPRHTDAQVKREKCASKSFAIGEYLRPLFSA